MEDVTTVQANAILLGLRRVNVEPIRRSEVGTHLDQEDMESYLDGLSVVLRTRCCISRTFTTSLCGLPARTRPRHFAGVVIAPPSLPPSHRGRWRTRPVYFSGEKSTQPRR